MARFRALLRKELRQHLGVAVGFALFLPFAWLMMAVGTAFAPVTISLLRTHTVYLWVFLPLTAMVLGNRLVVSEYHGRTQLFVEALPVRRGEMVAVKYLIGLVALQVIGFCSLLLSVVIASRNEPIDVLFVTLMSVRTAAYLFCLWSLFFTMGFLGRFRVPLYLAMGLLLFVLESDTALEISRFGPFAMVDNQLVLERTSLPWPELAVTVGVGAGWLVLAALLALINEGSVAEALARRMTLKEKSVAGALLIAALIGSTALGERPDQEPFAFQDEAVLVSQGEALEILYLRDSARPAAAALQEQLEGDLAELRRQLALSNGGGSGGSKLPALRVALRESLDARTFEPVGLGKNDGVLVRANFLPDADAEDDRASRALRTFLLRRLLDKLTRDRASFEPKAWVSDGFAQWLVDRDRNAACAESPVTGAGQAPCLPLLRALWATGNGNAVRAEELAHWFRYHERHGEDVARGVAFSGMVSLERRHGREVVTALARRLFGRSPPVDIRELFYEWSHPLPTLFHDTTGVEWSTFLGQWNAELDRQRGLPEVAAFIDDIPDATGTIAVERGTGAIRNLAYGVTFRRPPPAGTAVALLHRDLSPFERPLERHELRREEHVAGASEQSQQRLMGRYGPGTRLFVALELESTRLDCPLRLLAQRREIR